MSRRQLIIFLLVFLLSIILRLSFLNIIPSGFNWDEAAYSYNAYTLLHYGTDQYGIKFPLFLRSFGDYKPALLSYWLATVFNFFPANNAIARATMLPISTSGLLGIFLLLYKKRGFAMAVLLMLFVSIAPWHIHYSRAVMDPILGFSFFFLGFGLFFQKSKWAQLVGNICLLLAMYTYNAQRVLVPATYLVLLLWELSQIKFNFKKFIKKQSNSLLFLALQVLFFVFLLTSSAGHRATAVLIGSEPYYESLANETTFCLSASGFSKLHFIQELPIPLVTDIARQYFLHFQPDFLFFGKQVTARHGFAMYGLILPVFLPLIMYGLFLFYQKKKDNLDIFMLAVLLISPTVAAITTEVPHSGRTLAMLVPLLYLAVLGLVRGRKIIFIFISLAISINFLLYARDLYLFFPEQSSRDWQEPMRRLYQTLETENKFPQKKRYLELKEDPLIFMAWYGLLDPKAFSAWEGTVTVTIGDHEYLVGDFSDEQKGCFYIEPDALFIRNHTDQSATEMREFKRIASIDEFNRFHNSKAFYEFYETGVDVPDFHILCDTYQQQNSL